MSISNGTFVVNGKTFKPLSYSDDNHDGILEISLDATDNIFQDTKFYWITRDGVRSLYYCNKSNTTYVALSPIDDDYIEQLDKDIFREDQINGLTNASVSDALDLIAEFIGNGAQFTSMDISNGIKRYGYWIRNRRISELMNNSEFIRKIISYSKYEAVLISAVNDGQYVTARLYQPQGSDYNDYPGLIQNSLTPNEVKIFANNLFLVNDGKPNNYQPSTVKDNRSNIKYAYYFVKR